MKLSMLAVFTAFAVAPSLLAGPIAYTVTMNGASESPANVSPATGSGFVIFDTVAHTMYINISFTGLLGTVTASHIHCCTTAAGTGTAGVATPTPSFPGFPGGVKAGSYVRTFDMTLASSYRAGFITANGNSISASEAALAAGAAAGKAYFNIHTNSYTGGEIRGFLTPTPEPATFAIAGLALAVWWPSAARRSSGSKNSKRAPERLIPFSFPGAFPFVWLMAEITPQRPPRRTPPEPLPPHCP